MNEFFTWETLATFAGCSLATGVLTQFFKEVFGKLPTQWLSYIIAAVLLFLATAATGGFSQAWTVWAMIPLNAAIVSLSANGAYEAANRIKNGKGE
jgi:fatty acid desaturase